MGGLTGILAARQAGPGAVTKLVLVDVVPRFENEGTHRIRDFMSRHVHGFDTLDRAADAIAAYLPHRRRPSNTEGLKKNLRHHDGRWHWHLGPGVRHVGGILADDEPFVDIDELEQATAELQNPDPADPRQTLGCRESRRRGEFSGQVPHAEFVELSDAGHTAAGDDNDAFSDAVVSFVIRRSPRTPTAFALGVTQGYPRSPRCRARGRTPQCRGPSVLVPVGRR